MAGVLGFWGSGGAPGVRNTESRIGGINRFNCHEGEFERATAEGAWARGSRPSDTMRAMIVTDTSPAARAVLTGLYQKAGPEKCLRMALQMSDECRSIAASGIRFRHPDATEAEVRHELARLYLGANLADRLFEARRL